MAAKTTDDRLDELINMMKGQASRTSSSSSSDKKDSGSGFSLDADGIKKAASGVITTFDNVKKNVSESADMYQSLSKAGMNFSGDLFAMSNAAVGMRMSTKEMEESFLNFSKDGILKGFGTNLTNSAEGFAKASKHFFDNNSEAADSLRRMGFTTKDINEVLALQGVTLRGKFKDDQEMASVAANNAEKLANEMDSLSKLTGKSRAEQAEMMKKQQADMQFEAAIRLKTQGMSAEEAAKFEANARQQLHEANMLGQGQMFKEYFATGQIMTKEAATQAAINRDQAAAAEKMARTAADRTLTAGEREEKGNKHRLELMAAATKDMNDATKLQAMTLGDAGGTYSKTLLEGSGKQIDFIRTIEKTAAANNLDLKSKEDYAKAAKMAMEEIQMAQDGMRKDAQGKAQPVDASSRALAAFTGRIGDVQSVLNEKFVQPIQGQVNKALNELATSASASGNLFGLASKGEGKFVAQKLKSDIETGEAKGFKDSSGFVQGLGAANKQAHELINETIPKVKTAMEKIIDTVIELSKYKPQDGRSMGSFSSTGKIFEDFGPGTPMMLHGKESVMTPKDLDDIVKNAMEGTLKAIPKTGMIDTDHLSKLDEMKRNVISAGAPKTGNFDLNKVKDTINASISSSYSDKVDRKSLKFDQFGMPITENIKAKAQEIPNEIKKKEEDQAKKTQEELNKAGSETGAGYAKAAAKPAEAAQENTKPAAATTGKESTLNDVVQALNQLNTKVSSLIEVQKDIGQKQIKAVKANSRDVYAS